MRKHFPSEDSPAAHIMTTKELSRYLKLHEITICKYASEGQIPAIRIGRVWRFDKDVIDDWIRTGQNETETDGRSKRKGGKEESGKKKPRK
jgi:excisionase family DNA binding protein